MCRIGFILVLFLLFSGLSGQERSDFFYFDSITYRQYSDGRWKELSTEARNAVDLGYDYYYMRMRLGISLFERERYLPAIKQFRKALEFNNNDQIATEYIYYCYLNRGKILTANAVSEGFSESLRAITGIDDAPLNRIYIDNLYSRALTGELVSDYSGVNGYGETGMLIIPEYITNTGLTFSTKVSNRVSLTHAYTFLRRGSKLFYNDGSYYIDMFDQKLNQFQVYMAASFSNKMGLTFTPSVHYLLVMYPLLDVNNSGMSPRGYSYTVTENNLVSNLYLNRSAGLFDLGLEGSFAYLNRKKQMQAKGLLLFAPGGNNKFYIGGSYTLKYREAQMDWEQGSVINGSIGVTLGDRVGLELSALYGDLAGFIDKSGFIIYNMVNEKDYSLKTDISISIGKSGFVLYMASKYGSEYTCFVNADESVSSTLKENYKSITFLGGISWKF